VRPLDRAEADLHMLVSDSSTARVYLENPDPLDQKCTGEVERCNARIVGEMIAVAKVKPVPLGGILGNLRQIKDADELRRIRRAIEITNESILNVLSTSRPGLWEYEIEALIEYNFRRRGAERVGFPTIVGSGINSTTLHYDKGRRQTVAGDLVVTDVGAEFGYLTADVTRTFPISGHFTDRQRAIYNLVLGTQQTAIDSVRPGMDINGLNRISRTYMKEHSGTLCGAETCDHYFPHGLSHWLGMDTHDAGDYARKFEPGMILTVEPGIYLPEEALGVRIEDDILVTATGHEILSQSAPREAAQIEKAMADGTHTAAGH
jgi:Xaa-Pro aminopeptidase